MDGKGRYAGNILLKRVWRTVKYEKVYLKAYDNAGEARRELGTYFQFYENQRSHQPQGYLTPAEVFNQAINVQEEDWRQRRRPPESALVSSERSAGLSLSSASTLSNYLGPAHWWTGPYDLDNATAFLPLVSARYERGSIILTSNKRFGEGNELWGDAVIAPAVLDWLLHRR